MIAGIGDGDVLDFTVPEHIIALGSELTGRCDRFTCFERQGLAIAQGHCEILACRLAQGTGNTGQAPFLHIGAAQGQRGRNGLRLGLYLRYLLYRCRIADEFPSRFNSNAKWPGGETNGGGNRPAHCVKHHKRVAAPDATRVRTCPRWACCGRFERGCRVSTGGDGLLQLVDGGCGLRTGCAQVGHAIWSIGAPLGIAPQIEDASIGQFQAHRATGAGLDLFTREHSIPFHKHTLGALWGNGDYLANNTFDYGDAQGGSPG
nr:hypothetical protein [Pseudomonas inefficax]